MIHNFEAVPSAFELGDGVTVEPGAHYFTELWFNFQAPPGPLLRTDIDARIGGFYDGWRFRLLAEPTIAMPRSTCPWRGSGSGPR